MYNWVSHILIKFQDSNLNILYRPTSNEISDIVKLFDAGMSMARLNLSHGTIKENLKLINNFKQAKRLRPHKTCGLMVEVRGREVRLTQVSE